LVVDSDAVPSLSFAGQRLETVARKGAQVLERRGSFEAIEFQSRRARDAKEGLHRLSGREISSALVSIADNHSIG